MNTDVDDDPHPLCLGCGYDLEHLRESACPECGREFDPTDPSTFGPLPHRRVPWQALASIACTVIFFVALYIDSRPSAGRHPAPWYYEGSKFLAFIVLFALAVGCLLATVRLRLWVAATIGAVGVVAMIWQVVLWVIRFVPYS